MEINDTMKFKVWAPEKEQMILHIVAPFEKEYPMIKNEQGYFEINIHSSEKEVHYFYKPEGTKDYPDPSSGYQPQGVHGPSQTIDHNKYNWSDNGWKGIPFHDLILYEIHTGTFTPEGTFDAIIPRLDELIDSGINAIELMPVNAFPGNRNWGYDGVFPYAVQNSYGGPDGLKRLVDACHQKGICVLLDVVYNHLGPEGNYFGNFGPYFTKTYATPWGEALNYDGNWSDGVREFFADNIVHWLENYHIDGLRFDAIHTVFDNGAVHFWEFATERVKELEKKHGRAFHLVAESDLNSPKVVKPVEQGGYGFDAQWLDDFHHALYKMINRSDTERYYDFGSIEQLAKAYKDGFVHSGEWVKFRKRKYGASSAGISGDKFVVFNCNHDQSGNRAEGERLSMLVSSDRCKIAAAALMLSPYVPMLFMGEEYGDDTPFFYFVSHSDEQLIEAVRKGRKAEFEEFGFGDQVPDPQDEQTFQLSKIHWEKRYQGQYKEMLDWTKQLVRMRREISALKNFDKQDVGVQVVNSECIVLSRKSGDEQSQLICLFNFSGSAVDYQSSINGVKVLDSKNHPERISQEKLTLLPESVVVYSEIK
jgi:maltooligosyltrehalose trehalohydrolase